MFFYESVLQEGWLTDLRSMYFLYSNFKDFLHYFTKLDTRTSPRQSRSTPRGGSAWQPSWSRPSPWSPTHRSTSENTMSLTWCQNVQSRASTRGTLCSRTRALTCSGQGIKEAGIAWNQHVEERTPISMSDSNVDSTNPSSLTAVNLSEIMPGTSWNWTRNGSRGGKLLWSYQLRLYDNHRSGVPPGHTPHCMESQRSEIVTRGVMWHQEPWSWWWCGKL